jgi:hypothetical protein
LALSATPLSAHKEKKLGKTKMNLSKEIQNGKATLVRIHIGFNADPAFHLNDDPAPDPRSQGWNSCLFVDSGQFPCFWIRKMHFM